MLDQQISKQNVHKVFAKHDNIQIFIISKCPHWEMD